MRTRVLREGRPGAGGPPGTTTYRTLPPGYSTGDGRLHAPLGTRRAKACALTARLHRRGTPAAPTPRASGVGGGAAPACDRGTTSLSSNATPAWLHTTTCGSTTTTLESPKPSSPTSHRTLTSTTCPRLGTAARSRVASPSGSKGIGSLMPLSRSCRATARLSAPRGGGSIAECPSFTAAVRPGATQDDPLRDIDVEATRSSGDPPDAAAAAAAASLFAMSAADLRAFASSSSSLLEKSPPKPATRAASAASVIETRFLRRLSSFAAFSFALAWAA
mmetsp:Transcript_4467/g.14498  ORF Transcript_4467/g.14498 Transcript_4467/m.14498 type:complete len:276 (-) Transcript_4467:1559-2386(-)